MDLQGTLLESFIPGYIDQRFGATFLARFCKQTMEIDARKLTRYQLAADMKLNGSNYGQFFRHKYFDATFNFCLTHDRTLVASVGFEVDDDTITIWQIQGVKGARLPLKPIKWERALVHHTVGWAQANGAREVCIASVDNVSWAAEHAHLDPARGKIIYDVTAKRCGFRRCDDGYWRIVPSPA